LYHHLINELDGQDIAYDKTHATLRIPAKGTIRSSAHTDIRFFLELAFSPAKKPTEHHRLVIISTGSADNTKHQLRLTFPIRKDAKILDYAIASRPRVWVTGDTTIDGDIYSYYDNLQQAPFHLTDETTINGKLNVAIAQKQAREEQWQLETLEPIIDKNGQPIYSHVFDNNGDRIKSPNDLVQGHHEGINYDQNRHAPGMDIADYNTDRYLEGLEDLPDSDVMTTEYFSHAPGDYTAPKHPTSLKLQRHLYRDKVFSNLRLPEDRNALFINYTFNNTFYIDVYKSGDIKYNNVRFENCTFNGTLVTDVPQQFKWRKNVLTFTGKTLFQNKDHKATILAPHFNANLGNIDPTEPEKQNQINGIIISGIVDIRGNAVVNGTIISMADTTQYSDGYVTNIGATLNDGGSETTAPGNLGTTVMTPKPGGLLPNRIKTPIIIGPANTKELAYVKL
jgi:hypothetical protein